MDDVEIVKDKQTVRTVRLKPLTGPFSLSVTVTADGYTVNFQ
jgi:hypothetical protein